MIKYICIESFSIIEKGKIYKINIIVSSDNLFEDYIEIYDINNKYIGGWWINIDNLFTQLSKYREQQIDSILND